ncbi:MAG: hypothetical protein ACLQLT_05140 [Methylovirgula sp.]
MPTTLPADFICSDRNHSRGQSPHCPLIAIGLLVLPLALIALCFGLTALLNGGKIPWDAINEVYLTPF